MTTIKLRATQIERLNAVLDLKPGENTKLLKYPRGVTAYLSTVPQNGYRKELPLNFYVNDKILTLLCGPVEADESVSLQLMCVLNGRANFLLEYRGRTEADVVITKVINRVEMFFADTTCLANFKATPL